MSNVVTGSFVLSEIANVQEGFSEAAYKLRSAFTPELDAAANRVLDTMVRQFDAMCSLARLSVTPFDQEREL